MESNIIIHATKRLEVLKKILKSKSLKLSYSKERFCIGRQTISSAAHPMVCFCESSKIDLHNRRITYGKYGVAFTTDWGLDKKVSPVLYMDGNSLAAKGLGKLLRARQNKLSTELPSDLRLPIMEIKCFTKNVKGYNSFLKVEDFNFKNENEWRYVPRKSDIGEGLISQDKSKYLKKQAYYNRKLEPFPLKFRIPDIEVVYVSKKSEIELISEEFKISKSKIQVSEWQT